MGLLFDIICVVLILWALVLIFHGAVLTGIVVALFAVLLNRLAERGGL